MFIVPLSSSITPLNTMSQNAAPAENDREHPSFTDVFKEVVGEVQDTQEVLNRNAADLIMGDIDDLHTIYNNITKAEVALETFMAIKEAAVQSYKEFMQLSV